MFAHQDINVMRVFSCFWRIKGRFLQIRWALLYRVGSFGGSSRRGGVEAEK